MEGHLLHSRRSGADAHHITHQRGDADAHRLWVAQVAMAINSSAPATVPAPDTRVGPLSTHLYVEVIGSTIHLTTGSGIQILISMTRGFEVVHASSEADSHFATTVSDWTQALALVLTLIDLTGLVLHRAADVST